MKKKEILLFIFIFISIFSFVIIKPLGDLDEIWNYNTARAISEGLIPYKDVSIITTPLLPIITSFFLKIIANELMISRILTAILWSCIIFIIYKIFLKIIKEENACIIFTALLGILCRDIYCIDYNILVLLIALIILNMELNKSKKDILIGILAGLAICTKQSIGVVLAFIVILNKLILIENKTQIKQCLKISIKRFIRCYNTYNYHDNILMYYRSNRRIYKLCNIGNQYILK